MASVTFQREPETAALKDMKWRVHTSIGGIAMEDGRVVYTAQIILSSCDLAPGQTGTRKHKAIFSLVARSLRPLGYSAAWYGRFGLFQRAFESLGVLRQGVKKVRSLPLVGKPKQGRRRTRRCS